MEATEMHTIANTRDHSLNQVETKKIKRNRMNEEEQKKNKMKQKNEHTINGKLMMWKIKCGEKESRK